MTPIDKSTKGKTETILFNIDVEGSINKDKTAVLRVFAKMFYNHFGFYGENLKVALLEQYIDKMGKTEEFRRVFEEKKGKPWTEMRKAFAFNGKTVIPTLMEVLEMSEEDAKNWFHDKSSVEYSIAQLVEDIKAYVDSQPQDFRLLFMIDEVGQYIGTERDMLLNLQSIVEKIGSSCSGKVWVMCTGQEAIDEIIKVRSDEFSRIQARFKTRLSLSSASVDEVIQKRILKKKPDAVQRLESLYDESASVLRNLFSFSDSIKDIRGYEGSQEFSMNFPFVPYQFILMQKVFAEIRKHGNSGKHLSGGERSMLSGFQEAAQKVQERDEDTLVPFFRFYDTVHSFLDSSIRGVIERCQRAADGGHGIEPLDVDVLKLLYLIRYVPEDIPANVENIVILMVEDIRTDKIPLREKLLESLGRLVDQNYVGRTGNTYHFLTDEEQDVQREISKTDVDTSTIVGKVAGTIFGEIYPTAKFRYNEKHDFPFDKMVDGVVSGSATGGMKLRFLTAATDDTEKIPLRLMGESKGQAIVVLPESPYFENIRKAEQIRKFVKQKNIAQLSPTMQNIIRGYSDQATTYEQDAKEELLDAIGKADFYVDGEHLPFKGSDAKGKIDQAMSYLVAHVYEGLDLITKYAESDDDIYAILKGTQDVLPGMEQPNSDAAAKVEEFLIVQDGRKLPTSMFDVQSRYQAIPYGWREIDIAAVVARLIREQRVTIKYGGTTIQPDDRKLPDMLRKKSEIGKTKISKRQVVPRVKMNRVRELLRDYFDTMDVPGDEDGLVSFVAEKFTSQRETFGVLLQKYNSRRNYPDRLKVEKALELVKDVLSQQNDNIALVERLLKLENDLLDSKDAMLKVVYFFNKQVQVFDAASQMEEDLYDERDYLAAEDESTKALNLIRLYTKVPEKFSYQNIPKLNELMATVQEGHDRLLAAKRKEVTETLSECVMAIHEAADENIKVRHIVQEAHSFYDAKRKSIEDFTSLVKLDGLVPPMQQYMDKTRSYIEAVLAPPKPKPPAEPKDTDSDISASPPPKKKVMKTYQRQILFPTSTLTSEAEIDAYVEKIRAQLKAYMKGYDGIQLK